MVVYLGVLLRYKERSKRIVRNIKIFVLDVFIIKKIINLGYLSAMQMFF
jgi:MATE family multidrug resistance protein